MEFIPKPFSPDEVPPSNITIKTYRVSGTAEEHAALTYFLADRLYDWSV
jgi:hypothetical protein